jgi:hypothetical protein
VSVSARVTPSREGVTSSSQTPPLAEKEAPFQTRKSLEKKNTVMSPDGT